LAKNKPALMGIVLALVGPAATAVLVALSFVNASVNALIAVDKLILLTIGLAPFVYVLGIIVSITALLKPQMKATALVAVVLNIILLIGQLYFSRPFLMEFEFVV
jgi:hypothetical protein